MAKTYIYSDCTTFLHYRLLINYANQVQTTSRNVITSIGSGFIVIGLACIITHLKIQIKFNLRSLSLERIRRRLEVVF